MKKIVIPGRDFPNSRRRTFEPMSEGRLIDTDADTVTAVSGSSMQSSGSKYRSTARYQRS